MPTETWEQIENRYTDLQDNHGWQIDPMIKLVQGIRSSRFSIGLYPWTSHATLRVSLNNYVDFQDDLLSIDYFPDQEIFEFRMSFSDDYVRRPWTRTCAKDEAFSFFERVIRDLRWFVEYKESDKP